MKEKSNRMPIHHRVPIIYIALGDGRPDEGTRPSLGRKIRRSQPNTASANDGITKGHISAE